MLLNAALLGTFAVVPLLDGIAVEYDAVIESEHGACDYLRIHDHAICVQIGHNLASAAPRPAPLRLHWQWRRAGGPPAEASAIPARALEYERTRAPPLA